MKSKKPFLKSNPLLDGHTDRDGLAKLLNVQPRTIARWEKLESGGLPRIELGGRVIYSIESVRQWIAKRERSYSPPAPKRRRIGQKSEHAEAVL